MAFDPITLPISEKPPDEPELAPGTNIDGYIIEEKIGQGSFGAVFRAKHEVIGKVAAIKLLSRACSTDPITVARFVREARAVNEIRHPNIIDIFAFGRLADGRHYHIMELLEGESLDDRLRREKRLDLEEALRILDPLAGALDAAHAKGVIHRDLKPGNVFLSVPASKIMFPKLLDFGIAKLLNDPNTELAKTRTGSAMGTPLYMSPEQCRGIVVDRRSDVYSFGVMVYEMLAGKRPFGGQTLVDVLMNQINQVPEDPCSLVPDLPIGAGRAIMAMLSKRPDDRPQSVTEAVEALRAPAPELHVTLGAAFAEDFHDTGCDSDTLAGPVLPTGRRRTGLWIAAMVIALLAGFFGVQLAGPWFLGQEPAASPPLEPPPTTAEIGRARATVEGPERAAAVRPEVREEEPKPAAPTPRRRTARKKRVGANDLADWE